MHAGALEFRPDAPATEIAQAAGVIRASAHQALQDLREVIGALRDDAGDGAPERPQPSLTDLPALIDESRRAGMEITEVRRSPARELLEQLSDREREVVVAIGQGKSNAEIGAELYMSVATVKAHVSRLLTKLGLNNRVQVALFAHDAGLA